MPGAPNNPDPAPDDGRIRGEVESVVFHNEENGYTVLKLRLDGKRSGDPVTVVGNIPSVTPGENLTATGRWIQDRQYGRQFRAERIAAEAPQSAKGIERFLGSGLIEGIGKEYARRMVDKFGTEIFDVIDTASQRLEEIEGIGPKRRKQIKESWKQQKAVREIMVFLHSQGIGSARALRIYKTYGEEAVAILRGDPYRLARDIPGVGFKTADDIAQRMGLAPDSPKRLAAGLHYALREAASQGHAALPPEELLKIAANALGTGVDPLQPVLETQLRGAELALDRPGGGDRALVYLPEMLASEKTVALRVRQLASRPAAYPAIDAERAIAWFEKKTGFSLGTEQRDAVATAVRSRFLVITGGPGVGKTTILSAVLQILAAKKVDPVLCAPTGRAAKRLSESTGLDAATIHRLLEFQPGGGFARNRAKPLEGDVFVIDEASMIDLWLMHRLLDAIPDRGHVLLVGDVDQLPSVGAGSVLRDLIDSGAVPVARLRRIFRQAEASRIVTAAHAINEGKMPDLDAADPESSDFFFVEREDADKTLDTLLQIVADRLPARFGYDPFEAIQVLSPMNRNSLGTRNLNAVLQARLNPPAELKLEVERFGVTYRAGDKVIQTRNNYEKEVFNGDIGRLVEITTEPVKITVRFDSGHRAVYEPGELDELQLAYAITIHKSQGSEFPAVVIPLSTQHFVMLQRNLLYTGVTRGRKLVVLVGEKRALSLAVRNQESRRRHGGLRERLAGDGL